MTLRNIIKHLKFPASPPALGTSFAAEAEQAPEERSPFDVIRTPTAADFRVEWDAEDTFDFFETEDGGTYMALGTLTDDAFAEQLRTFLRITGDPDEEAESQIIDRLIRYPAFACHHANDDELWVMAVDRLKPVDLAVRGDAEPAEVVVLSW